MYLNILFGICCCLLISKSHGFISHFSNDYDSIVYLDTLKIIRTFGYPAEAHVVLTEDGYLLEMHRIPQGKNYNVSNLENSRKDKPPVLIQHGLLGSSANFLLVGPEQGLPFLLADMGYDVWLGNFRGNTYSKGNVHLSPDQYEFWEFSWHESGVYDLPAEIDYIREFTHHEKIIYVGFSMGTTSFFVLTSARPEYNDRIAVSHLLAPAAYSEHFRTPLIQFLSFTHLTKIIWKLDEIFLSGELLPDSALFTNFQHLFCEPLKIQSLACKTTLFMITGSDYKGMNDTTFKRLLGHFPAGYSAKGAALYGENERSGKFQGYDYGLEENLDRYGTPEPPEYRVENIRTPLYFYVGKNDLLSTIPDIEKLKRRLSSLKSEFIVDYPKFQHFDFVLSKNVKKHVYDQLISDLTTFLENNTISLQNTF